MATADVSIPTQSTFKPPLGPKSDVIAKSPRCPATALGKLFKRFVGAEVAI